MSTTVALRRATRRPTRRVAVLIAAAAAPVLFVVAQIDLELRHQRLIREAVLARHLRIPVHSLYDLSTSVGYSLVLYLGVAIGGVILIRCGYRVAWAIPAAILVLGSAVAAPHFPSPLGVGWTYPQHVDGVPVAHWYVWLWIGAITDLTLVLVPALAFARVGRGERPLGHLTRDRVLSLLVVATGVAIVLRTGMIVNDAKPLPAVLASACAFGLLAGTRRPWWPWAMVLFALAVGGTLGGLCWALVPQPVGEQAGVSVVTQVTGLLGDALSLVVCALVVSVWDRLADASRTLAGRPIWLLVSVNALNVADALLTQFAVQAGRAVELNPVIRTIGLPAKLALVGLLSWFLYRRRPAALLIPAAILLVVLAYHVSGLVIDS